MKDGTVFELGIVMLFASPIHHLIRAQLFQPKYRFLPFTSISCKSRATLCRFCWTSDKFIAESRRGWHLDVLDCHHYGRTYIYRLILLEMRI